MNRPRDLHSSKSWFKMTCGNTCSELNNTETGYVMIIPNGSSNLPSIHLPFEKSYTTVVL